MNQEHIRNVAIIAHVDHGKTTLVDQLLHASGSLQRGSQDQKRLLDSNELERERGITILAKCTHIDWQGYAFTIVDTPGHSDFGGEVERILGMVDGVILLVDAAEGTMPQTKFVLTKALEKGLNPIVVVNKMDRPDSRADEVVDEVFDLCVTLNATEAQLDFPVLYASAKQGWVSKSPTDEGEGMDLIFRTIVSQVPAPKGDPAAPLQMLVSILDYDPYLGRILTGRIYNGQVKENMPVHVLNLQGKVLEQGRLTKLFITRGLQPEAISEAGVGSIISVAGLSKATVSNTIAQLEVLKALPAIPVDPPTIAMTFSVNTSPLAGKEGSKLTSRLIYDRLMHEMEKNVSIQVRELDQKEAFEVSGRGELQLGILIETMRREGFELSISRPRVLFKEGENNQKLEPIEEVSIDVDEPFVGTVVEKMGARKGELLEMKPLEGNRLRLCFLCPSRGLIGFRSELLSETRGTAVIHRLFHAYAPHKGPISSRRNGVLISSTPGKSVAYALWNLEERGIMFVDPGEELYEGMVIGEHNRENDLIVNPIKGKKLSNVRAAGKDEGIRLTPPQRKNLEQALSYIDDDELVEVTPTQIRLRKRHLNPHDRKKESRILGG